LSAPPGASAPRGKEKLGQGKILGIGEFEITAVAGHHGHRYPPGKESSSVVGKILITLLQGRKE